MKGKSVTSCIGAKAVNGNPADIPSGRRELSDDIINRHLLQIVQTVALTPVEVSQFYPLHSHKPYG